MYLSETDKMVILMVAACLVCLTLIMTTCLVWPWCYMHKLFVRSKKNESSLKIIYPTSPESQHFHFSIVPVYGSSNKNGADANQDSQSSLANQFPPTSLNQYDNLTQLAEKARMRCYSLKRNKQEDIDRLAKIQAIVRYELVGESSTRLHIKLAAIQGLNLFPNLIELACYVQVVLIGMRSRRKSIINKGMYYIGVHGHCLHWLIVCTFDI